MTDDQRRSLPPDPTPSDDGSVLTSSIDMSWEAIWQRLRRVDELNQLCRYLSEFEEEQPDQSFVP